MEFHAVILCGPGKQLSPLSKVRTTGIHKPLLPLATVPMLEYVLDWCEKAFFPRITIACGLDELDELTVALDKYKARKTALAASADPELASGSDNTLQFVESIQLTAFNNASNGDVLRQLIHTEGETQSDSLEHFVMLPCDFITDLPPQVLIEAYRCRQDTDMGMIVSYRNQLEIEDKKNKIFPKNYTLYAEQPLLGQAQLADYYSNEDIDFHKALSVRTQLAWKQPNVTVSRRLLNSSIFFGDVLNISAFFHKHAKKYTDGYFAARPLIKIVRDLARKSWQSRQPEKSISIFIIPDEIPFIRANNLPVYMEANRHFLKIQARELAGGKPAAPKDKTMANVGADSIVAEGTKLGERTNVKRSVVGSNCVIGKRVKLTGCVILDGVTIGDEVQLENTIVGHSAIIHNKCKLTNCNVESTHEVAQGTSAKGDTLLCLSLEGLVDSEEESSSDDGEDSESSYDDYEAEEINDGLFGY